MNKKISNLEMSDFCQSMSMTIASGMSIEEGLEIIWGKLGKDHLFYKKTIDDLLKMIRDGESFNKALENSAVFSEHLTKMIKIASFTGQYEQCFCELAKYYKNKEEIELSIRNTIVKPLMFFGLLAFILVGIVFKILPVFASVYQKMSGYTSIYVYIAYLISSIVLTVIIFGLLIVGVFVLNKDKDWLKKLLKNILENSSLTKEVSITIARYQFVNMLKMLLIAGADLENQIAESVTYINHDKLKSKIQNSSKLISSGENVGVAFQKECVLDDIYNSLLSIALRNGKKEQALDSISQSLYSDSINQINNLVSIIEPAITIIFTASIGLSIVTVILPLISIISLIG